MDGCARSPANTSINHSDETWGGEKFLALRAATVVRKATKTMPLDDPLSLIPCTYIYIYILLSPSVPFFLSFSFPFLSFLVSRLFFFLSLSRAPPILHSRFDRREEN